MIKEELFVDTLEGIINDENLTTSDKKFMILNLPDKTFLRGNKEFMTNLLTNRISIEEKYLKKRNDDIETMKISMNKKKNELDPNSDSYNIDRYGIESLERRIALVEKDKVGYEHRITVYQSAINIVKEG